MRRASSRLVVVAATTVAAVAAVVALYAPHFLSPPPLPPPYHPVGTLHSARPVNLTGAVGPESLAFDPDGRGPYTGVADGRILRWDPLSLSWVDFAFTSPHRKDCTSPFARELEHICGRPLGLKFDRKSGDLYIADAFFGLQVVGPGGGLASTVATEAEGEPFYFANDLDIDEDEGVIYFTDTSTRYRRRDFMSSILSGDDTGRFMKYDRSSKRATVLLRGLAFANGVALSEDRSFVLVAETTTCRISRYWLRGPRAGESETFAELPGYPDNVRRGSDGGFWVALHAKKIPLAGWLLRNTWVGEALLKLPLGVPRLHALFMGGPQATVVKLSPEGEVVRALEDPKGGNVRYPSEVEERDGKLFIGSVMMPSIWIYDLH